MRSGGEGNVERMGALGGWCEAIAVVKLEVYDANVEKYCERKGNVLFSRKKTAEMTV